MDSAIGPAKTEISTKQDAETREDGEKTKRHGGEKKPQRAPRVYPNPPFPVLPNASPLTPLITL